ncbi:RNA polymerase sigma factor [Lentzea terrae]|uniref:RNA polymerase sigma factor n=1 Tax=Lentzea terrae TaxID=2200761 RepID=UPI0013008F46|nr:RNA polymerase sigma factor [Lentzea terrae]
MISARLAESQPQPAVACRAGEDTPSSPAQGEQIDIHAFTEFFKDNYPDLVSYAARIVGEQQYAEDVVAEAMTYLLENWSKMQGRLSEANGYSRTRRYMFGVVRNMALAARKKARRSLPVDDAVLELHAPDVSDISTVGLLGLDVKRVISTLPRRQHAVVALLLLGCSNDEISEHMGWSSNMTRMYLARARRQLKELLRGAIIAVGVAAAALGVPHGSDAEPRQPDEPIEPFDPGADLAQSDSPLHLGDVWSSRVTLSASPFHLIGHGRSMSGEESS